MIKIAFVVLFTIWISTAYGLLIERLLKLKNPLFFHAPLGFAALLVSLQLFYYPVQLLNLSSLWIHTITSIIYLLLFLFSLTIVSKIIKDFLRFETIWVIVSTLVFLIIFYYSSISIEHADAQMYLNYIAQNVDIDNLNLFNLWTGLVGDEFVSVYLFQGYYHFGSFLIKFVNSFNEYLHIGGKIDYILISMWGLGSLYSIISGLAVINFIKIFKFKNIYILFAVAFFALFFTNFYYWKTVYSFYGNTYRSILMAMMMFYLYMWNKHEDSNYKYLAMIVFGAAVTASSSSLFIGFSLLFGSAYYRLVERKDNVIIDSSYVGFFMVLYVLAMLYKDHLSLFVILFPVTILYYMFHKLSLIQNSLHHFEFFLNKYHKVIFLVLIPFLAIIFSIWSTLNDIYYPWNMFHYFGDHSGYDMVKNYIFLHSDWIDNSLNVLRWLGIFILFFKYKEESGVRYLLAHYLILAVFFLNPLTTSFISKAFASNVYYRLFETLFNAFSEILILTYLLNYLWSKKTLTILLSSSLIFVVLFSHYKSYYLEDTSSLYGFYKKDGHNVDHLYKVTPNELEVIQKFVEEYNGLDINHKQVAIISHVEGIRTFLPNVYQVFTARQYWSVWDRIDQDLYAVAREYYGWEKSPMGLDYKQSCPLILKYEIDYIINEKWENYQFDEAINECSLSFFENNDYRIRRVVYD